MEDRQLYFSGQKLYGDDFDIALIKEWFEDEKQAYAGLIAGDKKHRYPYHALNIRHGFRFLRQKSYRNVLGFGSAHGDEFLPIIKKIKKLTIVDPGDSFTKNNIAGIPCRYLKPVPEGTLPFADEVFDLIVCLGALHHIPNVTAVVKEMHRCLEQGGTALIREPIVSMGDWARPRGNLTKRERGIPLKIFLDIVTNAGLEIRRQTLCFFPPMQKLWSYAGIQPFNNRKITLVDAALCKIFYWNLRYHPRSFFDKFRPVSSFLVLHKK